MVLSVNMEVHNSIPTYDFRWTTTNASSVVIEVVGARFSERRTLSPSGQWSFTAYFGPASSITVTVIGYAGHKRTQRIPA
jgi:hypothetical protein